MHTYSITLQSYAGANIDKKNPLSWKEFFAAFPKNYTQLKDGAVQEVVRPIKPEERLKLARALFKDINNFGKDKGINKNMNMISEPEWNAYLSAYNRSSSPERPTIHFERI